MLIKYLQDLFCANVRGNVRENHGKESEKRKIMSEDAHRERVKFWTDDKNVFSLRYRGVGEEKREKSRQACIYRITLFRLFQYPSVEKKREKESAELVMLSSCSSRSFIKSFSRARSTYIFSSHPLKIF